MNVKINDMQQSDDQMTEEQQATTDFWQKKSWRPARGSLLTKFFADENFLLYSIVQEACCHVYFYKKQNDVM